VALIVSHWFSTLSAFIVMRLIWEGRAVDALQPANRGCPGMLLINNTARLALTPKHEILSARPHSCHISYTCWYRVGTCWYCVGTCGYCVGTGYYCADARQKQNKLLWTNAWHYATQPAGRLGTISTRRCVLGRELGAWHFEPLQLQVFIWPYKQPLQFVLFVRKVSASVSGHP
jgi:hypothetical protein